MSHIPAPWIALASRYRYDASDPIFDDGIWHVFPEGQTPDVIPGRLPICTIDRGDDHDAPTRAKAESEARLIAAAPELLAALNAVLASDGTMLRPSVIDQVKKAIAKAERRQP
jgi:hypothetical protein